MYFFSLITPTYNSAKFLRENINKAKEQTFQNFEHIFIDGFSHDGTVEIIKEYQQEMGESKVKIFQYPPKGITDAFNKGIKHASGKYLIHYCSDESFFNSDVLFKVHQFLSENNYDWIYGKVNVIKGKNSLGIWPKRKIWKLGGTTVGNYILKFFNFIPHASVFYKKEIFEKFGYFDETLTSALDVEYWLRIKDKTKWTFFDIVVSNYRVEETADSVRNREKYIKNAEKARKKYLNKFEFAIYKLVKFLANFYRKY
jgi:glycosyltransferase involved in cell wall biosynthesis